MTQDCLFCRIIRGEIPAKKVYEDALKENPKNLRAHFLLESIKKREKDKVLK